MNSKQRRRKNRLDKIPEKQLLPLIKKAPYLLNNITKQLSDKFYINLLNYNFKLYSHFTNPSVPVIKYYIDLIWPIYNKSIWYNEITLNLKNIISTTDNIEIIYKILEKSCKYFSYIKLQPIPDDIVEFVFNTININTFGKTFDDYPILTSDQQIYIIKLDTIKSLNFLEYYNYTLSPECIDYIINNNITLLIHTLLYSPSRLKKYNSMYIEQLIKYDIYNQNDDSQPLLYLQNYKEYIKKFQDDNLKNYIELAYICS